MLFPPSLLTDKLPHLADSRSSRKNRPASLHRLALLLFEIAGNPKKLIKQFRPAKAKYRLRFRPVKEYLRIKFSRARIITLLNNIAASCRPWPLSLFREG